MYVCMREREREMHSQATPQDTLAFFLMPLNLRHRFTSYFIGYCNDFLYLLNSLSIFARVFSVQWPITESNNYSVLLVP